MVGATSSGHLALDLGDREGLALELPAVLVVVELGLIAGRALPVQEPKAISVHAQRR
jgi:hypothetical protein